MADNVDITTGSGTTIAADEIASVKYQRIKLIHGADGVNAGDVSSANPLPVSLPAATVTTLTPPAAITGFATSAAQATGNTSLSSIDGKLPSLGQALAAASVPVVLPAATVTTLTPPAAITGFSTEATLASLNGKVTAVNTGSVTVVSMPTTAVTGTFWQATQPVSLASVPSHAVTNAGTFAVQVSSLPALAAGTANIGDVDVLTMPASAATVDSVAAKLATDKIHDGLTAVTPKFVKISGATSGNNTVVAAVTSKKIRVLNYRFQSAADVDVKFTDGAGGTDLTGAMSTGAKGGGGGASFSPVGHFETTANTALVLNLSAAVQVSGHLTYLEI